MLPLDEILARGVRGESDVGVVATRDRGRLAIIAWNYHDVAGDASGSREILLELTGLKSSVGAVREYRIDEVSANAYSAWRRLGSPSTPSVDQVRELTAAAELKPIARQLEERVLPLSLPAQSVVLIEIEVGE